MFLRCHRRKKDGKEHRYYSVEESRRLQSGRIVQRRVLYLGEINDSRERYVNPILRPRPLWFTVEVCKSVDARCGRSGEI
jgi:hypothetical protein